MDTKRICPGCQKPLLPGAPMGLCPECLVKAGFPTGAETETATGTHTGFIPPAIEEIAKLFPQLEIIEFIGKGGMGAVYKARQKQLNRLVALKILPPGIGNKPAFAERFTREAQALAQLNHPGIVTLYEFGETSGQFYFLMEFVDGVNLRQLLAASRVSAREALAIVPQICDALQFAHDQGIIHRDIKPENILLDRRGRVKVADFGLAKLVGAANESAAEHGTAASSPVLTESGKVMGTPNYMAPEQKEHPGDVDHRVDIYALGVVFYQMLTGELPGKRIEPPSKKVHIDVRLDEVVLRALEKKPELRYQQVSEVKTCVETIVATGGQATMPGATIRETRGGPSRFSRTAIAGAICVPFSFLPIFWFVWLVKDMTEKAAPMTHDTSWLNIVMSIAGFMGLTLIAPLLTTALGWLAAGQIRGSAGQLSGLKLAVFDGLVFPLLILDAILMGVWVFLDKMLAVYVRHLDGSLFSNFWDFTIWLVLLVLFVFWVDSQIIGLVWRAVNKSSGTSQGMPTSSIGKSYGWKIALGGVLALIVGFMVIAALMPHYQRGQVITSQQTAEEKAPVLAAESWLTLIDNGNYEESWKEAAPVFRGAVTQEGWADTMNDLRKPLGDLISRKLKSAQRMTQMPGAPDGEYVVMEFDTSFTNKKSAVETVTVGPEENGQWQVSGYYIK